MIARFLDTAMDRTVVLGYGNLGLGLRRRLPGWPADPPRMDGEVVLVTGAAGGLGLAAAIGFARLGASVRALGRNDERAADAMASVLAAVPGADVRPEACDLSSLADLRAFAARFREQEDRLDVLVLNAGVMPAEREHTVDGVELTFATHVLGAWVLIDELAGLLADSAPARVVVVSSGGMYGQALPDADDPQSEHVDYGPTKFYARTKRQQVVLAEQWAERLASRHIVVHSMHPGWADTEGVRGSMATFRSVTRPILRSPDAGADTIVWLGAAPEPATSTGRFWQDRRPRPTTVPFGPDGDDPAAREALWATCARLAGREDAL